ncbi:MAG: hypothetical protein HKM02_11905 [Pseudomonadales bacterium]|nr:hypothetical protein [Pseudomonadales bacterium]
MKLWLMMCAGFLAAEGVHASDWKLARDRHGVQVWKAEVADSPVEAFKARTVVHSSLSGLLALFYDVQDAPRWIDRCSRVQALQRNDAQHEYTLLMETNMPWPVTDRDAVMKGHWRQDPVTLTLHLRAGDADSAIFPPRPAFVRTRELRSNWTFKPLGHGDVEVTTEGHVNPEGHLPAWVINIVLEESPYNTMRNLQTIIEEPQFQKAHMPGVTEPAP